MLPPLGRSRIQSMIGGPNGDITNATNGKGMKLRQFDGGEVLGVRAAHIAVFNC